MHPASLDTKGGKRGKCMKAEMNGTQAVNQAHRFRFGHCARAALEQAACAVVCSSHNTRSFRQQLVFFFFKENPFLAFFTSLDCKIHRSELSHFCFFHGSPWILAKISKANWRTGLVQGLCTQPKYNRKCETASYSLQAEMYLVLQW